jgi:hypothetical protein
MGRRLMGMGKGAKEKRVGTKVGGRMRMGVAVNILFRKLKVRIRARLSGKGRIVDIKVKINKKLVNMRGKIMKVNR